MAGLVPAIHVFVAELLLRRGCPGRTRSRASRFSPGMTNIVTVLSPSAGRGEPRDQVVELSGMNEPHRGDRLAVAPGATFDNEAGGAGIDGEILCEAIVGITRGDA